MDAPYYSNFAPTLLTGSCTDAPAHTVTLDDGNPPPPADSCTASAFTFSLPAPAGDGTYTYPITQADDIALIDSAAAVFQWVYDTTPPPVPAILPPGRSLRRGLNRALRAFSKMGEGEILMGGKRSIAPHSLERESGRSPPSPPCHRILLRRFANLSFFDEG